MFALFETPLGVNVTFARNKRFGTNILGPDNHFVHGGSRNLQLFRNPLANQQAVSNVIGKESNIGV